MGLRGPAKGALRFARSIARYLFGSVFHRVWPARDWELEKGRGWRRTPPLPPHPPPRNIEQSTQEVLEILQPGPYNTPARWNAGARARAAASVRRAQEEWQRRHGSEHRAVCSGTAAAPAP